jgi:hypothetical protein
MHGLRRLDGRDEGLVEGEGRDGDGVLGLPAGEIEECSAAEGRLRNGADPFGRGGAEVVLLEKVQVGELGIDGVQTACTRAPLHELDLERKLAVADVSASGEAPCELPVGQNDRRDAGRGRGGQLERLLGLKVVGKRAAAAQLTAGRGNDHCEQAGEYEPCGGDQGPLPQGFDG